MRIFGHSALGPISVRTIPTKEMTMKKLIPAVFFQKQLNREKQPSGFEVAVKTPLMLDLFESEMREIVGGKPVEGAYIPPGSPPCSSGPHTLNGMTTYSGSQGWLDCMSADDCTT
jgi:hypothetical protein